MTVVGEEPRSAYNRVLLSAVVAGTMGPEAIALHDDDWATRTRVDLRTGSCATKIDRAARRVELADGSSVNYDALVLATGATPWLPPTEGLTTEDGEPAPGVVAFRTLDDCERILEAARIGAPVAVIGGGLLGLEAARGLDFPFTLTARAENHIASGRHFFTIAPTCTTGSVRGVALARGRDYTRNGITDRVKNR